MIDIADIRLFLRSRRISITSAFATVLVPLLAAFVFLLMLAYFPAELTFIQNMPGSRYLTNAVLILFILVGYTIVLLGLVLYLSTIYEIAFEYKGANKITTRASFTAMWLAVAAIILVFIFVSFIIANFIGVANIQFRYIVEINKVITLACFLLFTVIDLLIVKSKTLELSELQNIEGPIAADIRRKQYMKGENVISFSWSSTLLINFPIIAMTSLVWWLIHFISAHPASFEAIHDSTLGLYVPVSTKRVDWFLFLDGIETGMIASSVMVSQIIFLILKIRFQYREYSIERI